MTIASATEFDTDLYREIQHFYGRQMRHLDEDRIEEWVGTFTADGVFDANAQPAPVRGREAIHSMASEAKKRFSDQGIQRRHWLGMLEYDEQPDGRIVAKTYAVVLATPTGGQSAITSSTSCEDLLVREDGELLVQYRRVCRDDIPRG